MWLIKIKIQFHFYGSRFYIAAFGVCDFEPDSLVSTGGICEFFKCKVNNNLLISFSTSVIVNHPAALCKLADSS